MDEMGMMDPNCSMDMGSMTFHFSHTVPMGLLFRSWTINSVGDLIGAVIVWFLLGVLYEGLKTFREYLIYVDMKHWKKHNVGRKCNREPQGDKITLILDDEHHEPPAMKRFMFYSISVSMHAIQSVLHVIQVAFGYLLMLVVMTFNGWLFLAVIFGAGVGYLLFAKSRHLMGNFREMNEHCH